MKKLIAIAMACLMIPLALAGDDSDTLVFIREAKDSLGQPNMILERIQADGSAREVVFNSDVRESPEPIPFPKWQRSPSVSPLGKKLVLRRSWTISVMNWDGSGAVNVTPYRREWYDPRWSPDGRHIALCADIRDFAEIYVMNHDGGGLRNLTWKGRSNERSPDWSPDGKTLVFISDRNGKFELFTMSAADGSGQKRILSLDGDIREPAWGVGNRIAFALQKADGSSSLWTVDPDGANPRQLTDGKSWDGLAAWDAAGKRLAFVSNRGGGADIWVMDAATGAMRNVTNTPDRRELFPAWVPKQLAEKPLEVPSKDGVATNIAGQKLPRPRLLFRADDLPAIRDRFSREPYAPVWKAFLDRCDTLTDPASAASKRVEASIAAIKDNPSKGLYDRSGWITPIFELAFARQVTGKKHYGTRAAEWLLRVAAEYARWHQDIVYEYPVACAYDWLYDLFEPDDLRQLTGLLQTGAARSFKHLTDYYFGETKAIEGNFATHTAGSVGPLYLALSGEPGSNAAWLPGAARLAAINLNTWIGPAGDAAEGTSYFNYPVGLMMPFLVSLKRNDLYPETRNNNLRHFADWYAIVNAGGVLPSIGDSDGGRITFPVGLLTLYPDNRTARKLWNGSPRPEQPAPNVLSLLWFVPSENKPQDYAGFPKTAYFDAQNYQVFRTGYRDDSSVMTFTLTAGGHAHQECGALSLHAFGSKLLVDPGQMVSAADCHSQLLIDGQGRFDNYRPAGAPKERIAPVRSDAFAAASAVNMVPAFASRVVGSHANHSYSIPGPGIKLQRGSRVLAMVGDDTTDTPPYYLVFDDVRLGDRATRYEQLYIGQADAVAHDNGDGSFVYRKRYGGSYLAPVAGAAGEAALEFAVEDPGDYQVWVYMKENPHTDRTGDFTFRIGQARYHAQVAWRTNRAQSWQWAAAVFGEGGRTDAPATRRRISGEPVVSTVHLAAGKHTLHLVPRNTLFAKVALVPAAQSKTFTGWGELPKQALVRTHAEAEVGGKAWRLEQPGRAPAQLLVASLTADAVTVEAESFSFNTRFHGQQFVTLPRTRLVKRQIESNFLTLVYPHLPGMQQPTVGKQAEGATLAWKDTVDTIRVTDKHLTITRTHKTGKQETFTYTRPEF